jgi:DNA-binding Xre family transcriptional regulator
VVPREWFIDRPLAVPDFGHLAIRDFGQTVALGGYEVASDAILYEFDSDYRKRMKHRHILENDSFGGSVHRLRLQKGVLRSDFPGLSAKELARIERGEIAKPHARTLSKLARRLGVHPGELASY